MERLEVEDAEHEGPGVTLEQIQQDIDKAMEVQDRAQPESLAAQEAEFDKQAAAGQSQP